MALRCQIKHEVIPDTLFSVSVVFRVLFIVIHKNKDLFSYSNVRIKDTLKTTTYISTLNNVEGARCGAVGVLIWPPSHQLMMTELNHASSPVNKRH